MNTQIRSVRLVDRLRNQTRVTTLFLALVVVLGVASLRPEAIASGGRTVPVEPPVLEQIAATGEATFWVLLREQADLSPAHAIDDWNARGSFVAGALQSVADRSQADLRTLLRERGTRFQPFWIVNAIRVTAGPAVLDEMASRPEVERVVAARTYRIPEPTREQEAAGSVEWNVERIGAPQVWSTFGVRGEGIVVANIDTGVQFDHPALVRQYRGTNPDGLFDHDYDWFDPSNVCGSPSLAPCDNQGHGTHTMGTMVGDDGDPGANQIGVAPHARWIAAKGCEILSCSDFALLSSGQWVLAPTDLAGQNPRPDLRPHVVNNSWGTTRGDDVFYQAMVQAWVASGMFPVFSNGNSGPKCETVGAPGSYPESYGVGAFDINNQIASFSSRGPSPVDDGTKPDISAPGVAVRSSVPPNTYQVLSGTSMAAPHASATVALMWSAAPVLTGDIAGTIAMLDQTAIDTEDLSCGGTPGDNNVWGEGRLDALAAVAGSPKPPIGTLQGVVVAAGSGEPIPGATVRAVGTADRSAFTDPSGAYHMLIPAGSYDVTASAFGYFDRTATGVVVTAQSTTTADFALPAVPAHTVSGHVRDGEGNGISDATLTILGTPLAPTTTDATGFYSFSNVPEGDYQVRTRAGCFHPQTLSLSVDGDETLDVTLAQQTDSFGYSCTVMPFNFIQADSVVRLSGDDKATAVPLPFPFRLYGENRRTAFVATNGFLNFLRPNTSFRNDSIPSPTPPNAAIYPFWDDLLMDAASSVRTQLIGATPNRQFVIEWRNVTFFVDPSRRVSFEVVLYENGNILMQYTDIGDDTLEQGESATIGLENATGTTALQFARGEPILREGLAVLYEP